MTDEKRRKEKKNSHPKELFGSLSCEVRKDKHRCAIVVTGVVKIASFSDEKVELISHGGRFAVSGEGLSMTVFEDKSVEIFGRISGVELGYAKN